MKSVFTPALTLAREPDGEFTLHAVTVTPNSAYSAGRARQGPPPNVRITGDTEAVVLELRHRGGVALQVLTPVRHTLGNLRLDKKTSVMAFVTLNGAVVGSASIPVEEQVVGTGPIGTSDWYAWANLMPPGPGSLHVQGLVQLPTPGYAVQLRKATPQGFNPRDLILDLEVTAPASGFWPQVVTAAAVSYVEPGAGGAYDTVLVRVPGGESVQLTVEQAH